MLFYIFRLVIKFHCFSILKLFASQHSVKAYTHAILLTEKLVEEQRDFDAVISLEVHCYVRKYTHSY